VRGGDWFVESPYVAGFHRYRDWLARHSRGKLVVLDIGSGFNTPVWIRWPAERLVQGNPEARLLRVNLHHPEVPAEIASRSVGLSCGADVAIDGLSALSSPVPDQRSPSPLVAPKRAARATA
jgi:hypothetical protein